MPALRKSSAAPAPKPGFKYKPQFGVVVVCKDERDQERTYTRLQRAGYKLKVVTV